MQIYSKKNPFHAFMKCLKDEVRFIISLDGSNDPVGAYEIKWEKESSVDIDVLNQLAMSKIGIWGDDQM